MQFRSEIQFPYSDFRIGHGDGIVAVGSCFAGRMGQRLQDYKFRCLVNPFGIVYHPDPLIRALRAALAGDESVDEDLFEHAGKWHSFLFHSELSHAQRGFVVQTIRQRRVLLQTSLLKSKMLILTLGTAIGFRHQESGEIVGNNHKLPQKDFIQEMSKMEVVLPQMQEFLDELFAANPKIQVLLTVSPVRHLRSGMVENSASKAILRTICHELSTENEQVEYFPAFEIMMDDLRDYRFYQDDLIHPTPFAEQYIWNQFAETRITPKSREWMERVDKIKRDLAHRPFDPSSEAHQEFLKVLKAKIESLNRFVDMGLELRDIEEKIHP
jgi:lysophospholipase L1-like esterase